MLDVRFTQKAANIWHRPTERPIHLIDFALVGLNLTEKLVRGSRLAEMIDEKG